MKNIFLAFTFLAIANSSNAFEVNLDDRISYSRKLKLTAG